MTDTDSFFPKDAKKLRERIRRYERAFRAPHHDDGAGKRFLLGPLYLFSDDQDGALGAYAWYENAFPDDTPEAFNHLCWTLTLLRANRAEEAKRKLRELAFSNFYVVPAILGHNPSPHPFRHFSNWNELSYITEGPYAEYFSLWKPDELEWLGLQWAVPQLQCDITKFMEVQKRLEIAHSGPEREALIALSQVIERGLPESVTNLDDHRKKE